MDNIIAAAETAYNAGYKAAISDAATALLADKRVPFLAIEVLRPLGDKTPKSPAIEQMKKQRAAL